MYKIICIAFEASIDFIFFFHIYWAVIEIDYCISLKMYSKLIWLFYIMNWLPA